MGGGPTGGEIPIDTRLMLSALLSLYTTSALAMAAAPDGAMAPTYKLLAKHLLSRESSSGKPHWVCIAGGPGSGKSTLAEAVCALINEESGVERAVVLPMDGFHYSRAQLRELDPPDASEYLPRRGAPWTFDAKLCYECFSAAKRTGEASLPTYSRIKSDPVPGGVQLKPTHDIVLVEGDLPTCAKLSVVAHHLGWSVPCRRKRHIELNCSCIPVHRELSARGCRRGRPVGAAEGAVGRDLVHQVQRSGCAAPALDLAAFRNVERREERALGPGSGGSGCTCGRE